MIQNNSLLTDHDNSIAALTAQLRHRDEELIVINSVQEALAAQLSMQDIYKLVGEKIREIFNAQVIDIVTYDREKNLIEDQYAYEKGETTLLGPREPTGFRKHIIQSHRLLLLNHDIEKYSLQYNNPVVVGELPKSAVLVPLISSGEVTGIISLQNLDQENAFSESDVNLLTTLANSMSVALKSAHLFDQTNHLLKETEQRTAELAVINSVQEGLAKELDIQAIYDLVGNRIRDLFDAQVVGIATFDHEKETENIHYLIEKGERYYPVPRPLNILRKHLIQSKEKILINKNFEEVAAAFGVKKVPGTEQPKSALYVPMMIGEKVTGNISLQNIDKENAISESDVRLLETIANSMSVALENARLFDETNRLLKETEQQKAELGVINSVQEGLAKELNMQAIYDLVGDRIRELFNAQAVMIVTFDHETATEHFKYLIEDGQRFYLAPRPYDRLRQHLIMTKQKIVINSNYAEAYAKFGLKTLPGTNPTKSGVFVPLIIGDKVNSYISLQNMQTENAFSESDVRLLETLANSMSVALENARLFDETNRLLKETEQGKAELAVINSVQEGLVREMDIQGIYNLVGDRIQKLFAAQVVIIATFDHDKKLEYFNYYFEKGEISHPDPRHFDKVRKHLIETGQNILINENVLKAVTEFGMKVVPGTEMPKSLLFMPLKVGDKVNGYVSLQNIDKENAFSFSDVRLLSTLANSMSVALENARLFDETNRLLKVTEQGKAELGVINNVQEGLVRQLDMQGIYELVGEKIREIFNAQVIDIATYDSVTGLLEDRYAYEKGDRTLVGTWKPSGFRKHVIDTAQLLLINEDLDRISAEFDSKVLHGEQPKSALFVPLVSGNEVKGMISLQNLDKEHAFSDSQVGLLTTLANSMSVALESARRFDETNRLLKETEQRTAELAVINSVQEGLAKELNIQGIYDLIGNKIRDLFDVQAVVIATFNHEAGTESFNYTIEKGERFYPDPRPLGKLRLHLIQSRKKVVINKQEEGYAWFGKEVVAGTEPIKSGVFVPLMIGDKITSYVTLQNIDRENAFSDSDVRLLETLANSMSVALENARLFDETNRLLKETEQRTAELSVINSVQDGLAREVEMQGIYELVGEKIREIFKAQVIDIATYDNRTNVMDLRYSYEKGDRTLVAPWEPFGFRKHIIDTAQSLVINEDLEKKSIEFNSPVIYGEMPKSLVFVPLISGNEVKGMISLQNLDKEHAFTDSDVSLLTTLANSMSVALESARHFDETNRLLKETEQRNAELAVINSVQESLVAQMDMQSIYELVGEKIREIFGAQVIDIVLYDKKVNLIEDRYSYEKGDRTMLGPREPKGFRKHVIQTKQLLLHNENVEQAMRDFDNVILIGETPKSQIYVPMMAAGEVTGIISLQNLDHEKAFTNSDVNLITTLANSMSVALESARLFDETNRLLKETEQRNAELAVINSVQESLVAQMDMQSIYELVGEKIREIFGAQVIDIVLYDKKANLIEDRYAYEKGDRTTLGPREPKGFRKHVIKTKQLLLHNENVEQAMQDFDNVILIGEKPKSQIYVPMMAGGEVNGIISLQNLDHENAFSDSDVNLITTLANSMSVALESARLFDETNRLLKETEQRTAELSVINSVQEGLAKELNIQGIYELVGEKMREIFNAQVIDIVTYDSTTNLMEDRYSFEKGDRSLAGTWKPEGFRKTVIESGQLLLINENLDKISLEYNSKVLQGEQPKSAVFVPLISGNEVKGMISLQNLDKEHAFSDSDVNLLTTLANSMTVALESARLFDETNRLLKETEQRTAELSVINSVQEGLAKELDIQGIYELVGEKMREIFNAQVIDIVTYDKTNSTVEDRYTYEKGDRALLGPRPLKGFRKHVIETAKPLVINKDLHRQRSKFDQSVIVGKGAKSIVLVPMIASGEVTGVISLQNLDQENAFSDADVNLLSTLSNSMSVALESARLFDETTRLLKETEQRTGELSVINSVQEGLAKELDMQGIYELIGDRVQKLFSAQSVLIATLDLDNKVEHFNYAFENGQKFHHEPRPINKLRKLLIEKKHSIYIPTEEIAKTEYGLSALAGTQMSKSLLFVPLLTGNVIRGYVSLQNVDIENAFSESDIRLLETLANSMSVALENARLFDETNRLLKETEQRTAELAVINSVQEGLAKELDMQGIYNLVGDRAQHLFQTHAVIIASFDLVNNTEHFNYAFENGEKYQFGSRPINNLRQILVAKKQTIHIENETRARDEYGITAIGDTKMPKSLMFVPLLSGNAIKGYVSIQNVDKENAFNESDVRLLETLANSMSVALENARLFDETNRLLKETEIGKKNIELLSDIGKEITASLDFETIFYKLYEHINQLADATIFGVGIYNAELQQLEYKFAIESGKRYEPYTRSTANKDQFPVWCIENRKPVFINDVTVQYSKYISEYKDVMHVLEDGTFAEDPLSLIYLPLVVQEKILGVITIQSFKKNAYTEYHLNLLQNLATYTGIAIDNANAYRKINEREKEIAQRAAELSTVNSISQALAVQLNLDDLIKLVGDKLLQLFNANIVYLALLDRKSQVINFPYQYGDDMAPMKLGEGLTSKIILTGEPLLLNKDLQELRAQLGVKQIGIPAASYLGVPIPAGDEIIGVLSIQSTEHENRFNQNDLHLLSTIAASVGVAIRKAKLFEEVHQAKMEAETASNIAEKANQAKSAFLSTVSHELRTPLTSVLGFAKIIKKRLEDKIFPLTNQNDAKTSKTIQQISENLSVVISEGERLTNLINEVLDLAKIEAGKMEWNMENVSMQEVAERAMAATTSLFEQKGLLLEKHMEADLPFISGDRDKLIQVMVNLISNAVKFTPKGTVTCSTKHVGDEIIVSITDTGIGIAPQDYDAVFEQFKQVVGDTLTDKPKGTGLGLPICKQIVEHHGGRIWLESEAGKGSTFSFALPVIDSEPIKPLHLDDLVKQLKKQMAEANFKIEGKNSTILVVDDDGSIRSLLHQELSDAGYLIEEATNGKEALESVRKNRPDLIILDIMMPEMNGFDVAAILKNDPETMDIPIIVLSIVQDKARGYRIGVDRYLTKPIDTAALFSEVGTLLEQGKSKRKVMVVDEDSAAVRTLSDVLHTKGYHVVESDGKALLEKAIATQPDIIILNSIYPGRQEIVQTLRFEKGLENVLFLIYQ